MLKRIRQNKTKLRSKKGMTLVELIVGIVIIVIVFGATLSAMTNGYTDTLFNADQDKAAARCSSLNEAVMEAVTRQKFRAATASADATGMIPQDTFQGYFFSGSGGAAKSPNSDAKNAVQSAAKTQEPDVVFVTYSATGFPADLTGDDAGKPQYTINPNASSKIAAKDGEKDVKGMEIITYISGAKGSIINRSFVAYTSQS